jgi:hypothetical protein
MPTGGDGHSKLLVATRADDGVKEMAAVTHPVMRRFAKQWKADFLTLRGDFEVSRHYRIMELHALLEKYDRVLSLDTDTLILPSCPNPFKKVSEDCIGSIFEDKGSRQNQRRALIHRVQDRFGNVGWETGYINTGVFLASSCHRDIFQPIDGEYWDGWGFDDIHLGWQIHKHNFPIHELHWKWDHMTMFSERWNNGASRFNSFIIHYAGQGRFNGKFRHRQAQIEHDYRKVYG